MLRGALGLALVCHLALSAAYLLGTPAFEGPDENDHYYYAFHLAHKGTLPIIKDSGALGEGSAWDQLSVGHHPPLYYLLLAATLHALGAGDTTPSWSDAGLPAGGPMKWRHGWDERPPISRELPVLWALRAWSVLLGLATIVLAHRIGRVLFPDRGAVADLGALLLACLPQWSFTHAVLDNGNLATALGHAAVLVLLGALAAGRLSVARGAALGVLCGLALVSKLTAIFVLPLLGLAWLWLLARSPARRGETFAAGLLAAGLVMGLAGWFFLRNRVLYGGLLAQDAHRRAFAENLIAEDDLADYLLGPFVPDLFGSFVGCFGWQRVGLPGAALAACAVVAGLAVLGWCVGGRGLRPRPAPLLAALAAVALVGATVLRYNLTFYQPQGRYLFPAAGPILLLVAAGLVALADRLRVPRGAWLRAAACAVPIAGAAAVAALVFPRLRPRLEPPNPWHASLVAGIATPPAAARATIELLAPADGAEVAGPPTFRWRAPPAGDAPRCYTVHAYTETGRILFATFEWAALPITGTAWTMPASHWQQIPTGVEILWKVRRLPDRSRGEEVGDVPESPPRRLRRRR